MELIYQGPQKYKKKIAIINSLSKELNPVNYVNSLCNLKGLSKIILIHKPIKFAAQFQEPNKIFLDLRNNLDYINLSLAHEYTHLLLRYNQWTNYPSIKNILKKHRDYRTSLLKNSFEYSIEQSIAILGQLSYEDKNRIRAFKEKKVMTLMRYMDVLKVGQFFLQKWNGYWKRKYPFHSLRFSNILDFIGSILKESF
ncbi:MAG: hypothetical protein KBI07_07945 [Candidatus Atribacteria bacterium]|nr:hypothetical protein [Candidatus Atribacteria bacterium]